MAGDNVVIIGSMGVNTGTRLWANGALTPVGEEYTRGFKAMHALSGDVPLECPARRPA